jgi:hypothetical protein
MRLLSAEKTPVTDGAALLWNDVIATKISYASGQSNRQIASSASTPALEVDWLRYQNE